MLDVADTERAFSEAAILHARPNTDPAIAAEQERKCEFLKAQFTRAKMINNESIKTEIKKAERREEITKEIKKNKDSKCKTVFYSRCVSAFYLKKTYV